jgi:hypothetical protein
MNETPRPAMAPELTSPPKDEVARIGKPFLFFDRNKTTFDSDGEGGTYSSKLILVDPKTRLRLSMSAHAVLDLNKQANPLAPADVTIVLVSENLDQQPLPALTQILGRLQFQTRLLREKEFGKLAEIERDSDAEGVLKFEFDVEGINRAQLYTMRGLFTLR